MGLTSFIKDQFIDVIEYIDESNKILVSKYTDRPTNEIKQGAKVIVREGQCAAFVKGGRLADILYPGTHELITNNLPILSTLEAFPHKFNSPIKSDLFFISTKQSVDNKWATKNPIMMRDDDFGVIRLRAFGTFAFKIEDPELFMKEVFGSQELVQTWDIVQYFSSMITESFAAVVSEIKIPILDLSSQYGTISDLVKTKATESASEYGIKITKINVESISLPDEVEKLVDEQSGMGIASKDMKTYAQYQSVRSMRDSANQPSGIMGLGAGFGFANQMMNNVADAQEKVDIYEEITKYKALLDSGAITQEEFDALKAKILK